MALETSGRSDAGTIESVKRELSIFDRRAFQVTHLKADWVKHIASNNSLGSEVGTPITFTIPRAPGLYIDLNDSYCVFEVHLSAENGVTAGETAYINNSMHSLFKDVSLSINGTKVEGENSSYAYKAYLYSLFGSTQESKKYQMHVQGWMHDEAKLFDSKDNKGFKARSEWTKTSSTVFCGPLFLDMWLQEQYLTDACDLSIKFTRNTPEFCVQTYRDKNLKIDFKRAEIWLRKISPSPSVIAGHLAGIARQNAVWPYNAHRIIKSFHEKGVTNINIADCASGIYPKCIIAGMVSTESYNGTLATTPYNFKHYNVCEIGTKINGQHIPQEPYKPNFAKGLVAREYLSLMMMLGREFFTNTVGLTMEDYINGNTFFAFNYAPDLMLIGHGHPARLGNINLEIKFDVPLPEPIVLMLFCIYDSQIEMTASSNIILDSTQAAN